MPNQCVHCGKLYAEASKELLTGCTCGSHFFYFIKREMYERLLRKQEEEKRMKETDRELAYAEKIVSDLDKQVEEFQQKVEQIEKIDKERMERDVREIIGMKDEEMPVILDLESIRVIRPGKFEIDVVNLFNKKRPLIYKLEEGKYIIDLASTLRISAEEAEELKKKIKDPEKRRRR